MDITPQVSATLKIIQSYKSEGFRINGALYSGAIIVSGDEVVTWKGGSAKEDFSANPDIQALVGNIDVLLIGVGNSFSFMTPQQRQSFKALGFSVDMMDTPAACRTYNVLTAEGRRVAVALLPCT